MVSVLKLILLLTWKSVILRMSSICLTISEVFMPVACMALVYYFSYEMDQISPSSSGGFQEGQSVEAYPPSSPSPMASINYLAYSPSNAITDGLMERAKECFWGKYEAQQKSSEWFSKHTSDTDIEKWLKTKSIDGKSAIAVIFKNTDKEKPAFQYTIRTNSLLSTKNFKDLNEASMGLYEASSFLPLQTCVDQSILQDMNVDLPQIKFGVLPELSTESGHIKMLVFVTLFVICTIPLVLSISGNVIEEKASGIKEMMKMVGIPLVLIWFQWVIFTIMVNLPVTIFIAVLFTLAPPFFINASTFIVWLILFLFFFNVVAFIFLATCLFKNKKLGISIILSFWIVVNTTIHSAASPFDIPYKFVQILICFFLPIINLAWAFETMISFQIFASTFTLSSILTVGYAGSMITIGESIIIFMFSTLLFALLTAYVDAVRPGPYGMAKSPLFVCDWIRAWLQKTSDTDETHQADESLPSTFEPPPKNAKVGIEIRGLRKVYGRAFRKEVAVDSVNLDIYEGEIMVLLGHNGAGKTTTMSMITGMFSPTSGTIKVEGRVLRENLSTFRQNLGLCTQHDLFFPKLTVIDHLIFFGVLKGMSFSEARTEGMELLHLLNIRGKANSLGRKLSGGMKRRLCLANSLTGNPHVLILDEPTSGLDPETRRVIWNILLGFRGSRTILITTHFMEEADVLGDRIAIMDHGKVICCGTSMFLKKNYGSGYNVHVLMKPNSSAKNVSSLIKETIQDVQMRVVSPSQVDFIIKGDYVERFPELFSRLERSQSSLGVTGFSVSSATLEEVFLKVAELQTDAEKSTQNQMKTITNIETQHEMVEGSSLFFQRIEALTKKRLIHFRRKWLSYIIYLVASSLLIFSLMYNSKYKPLNEGPQNPLLISLKKIYPGTDNPIKVISDSPLKQIAVDIIKQEGGGVRYLSQTETVDEFVKSQAKHDFYAYLNRNLLGLTFSDKEMIVQYQSVMNIHMPAIAANLIANIMIKSAHSEGSIQVTNHPYILVHEEPECPPDLSSRLKFSITKMIDWQLWMGISLIICMFMYVDLIAEEFSSGFRHQQMIAGLSTILYWSFNYVFDFCVYLLTLAIWLAIIFGFGYQNLFIDNTDLVMLLVLTLVLHGLNIIAFVYFVFYLLPGSNLLMYVQMINFLFVVASFIIYFLTFIFNFTTTLLLYCFLSLNPIFATIMSVGYIIEQIITKYMCRVCKESKQCENLTSLLTFPSEKHPRTILIFTIFLSLLWILYLFLVMLLDSNLYRKLFEWFCHSRREPSFSEEDDDDVIAEAERVEAVKEAGVSVPLMVNNLVKKFLFGPKAVNNVSFIVEKGECFGLLGVNGAGKTTTFKILTGELLPKKGDAEVLGVNVFNRGEYMNRIGYCPQFDACLKMLTGRETLKTIALIRGVPRSRVKTEVSNWLEMMGITEHADKRTSTYSGGTRRKLSTAMAFMGEPIVVLLDEPTTGVDPVSRRKLWSVIQARQRSGEAVVLTSHSMEECEALCTRLTIMKQGRMRCVGTVEYLKNKFRLGFVAELKLREPTLAQLTQLKQEFTKVFPGAQLKDESPGMVQYEVRDVTRPLSNTFEQMLRLKQLFSCVQDFTVNNTTLEQLFLSIAEK